MFWGRGSGNVKPSLVLSQCCCITQSTTATGMKRWAFTGHLPSPSPQPSGTNTAPSTGKSINIQPFIWKGYKPIEIEVAEPHWEYSEGATGFAIHAQDIGPSGSVSPSPAAASLLHWKECTSCPGGPCGRKMMCWSTFRNEDAVPSTLGAPPTAKEHHSATSCLPFQEGRVTRKLNWSPSTDVSLSLPDASN